MMVTPRIAQRAHDVPHVATELHVHAGGGFVQEQDVGARETSAFAIITRRFMPPESVMIFESFLSHSESCFQHPLDDGRDRAGSRTSRG